MTYRDVFLKVNPHVVHKAIGWVDIEMEGRKIRFRSEQPFTICQGLAKFAKGCKYLEDEETVISDIRRDNSHFELTDKQVRAIYNHRQTQLFSVVETLGFSDKTDIDEKVNKWLDQSLNEMTDDFDEVAIKILSKLIQHKWE